MFFSGRNVDVIRNKYPEGCIVKMINMPDDPRPIAPGTTGEVVYVDDVGTVHTNWSDGRMLGFVPGVDKVEIVK